MPRRVDPYAELGVLPTASQAEIQAAFRKLARDHHPDTNADPAAERRFKRVAHAYEHIKTAAARRAWDARRAGAQGGGGRPATFVVDHGPLYHSDLGHHSDFYMAGDPLTIAEAAVLVGRDAGWLRRAAREGRLAATRGEDGYLVRRRDVERLDRSSPRRRRRGGTSTDGAEDAG